MSDAPDLTPGDAPAASPPPPIPRAMSALLSALPPLPHPIAERASIYAERVARTAASADPAQLAQLRADGVRDCQAAATLGARALRDFADAVRAERVIRDALARLEPAAEPPPFVRETVIPAALARAWLAAYEAEGYAPPRAA